MHEVSPRVSFEKRKDSALAAISSFLIASLSLVVFSNSQSSYINLRPDVVFVLAMVIGLVVYKAAVTPKAKISIGKSEGYIEYMYIHESGRKVEGTVKIEDIDFFVVEPDDEQEEFFKENTLSDEELWRTKVTVGFSDPQGEHVITISGRVPDYTESLILLRKWGILVKSEKDVIYQLNRELLNLRQ